MISPFQELFGETHAPRVASAPGRVNLIGDHTDYNDGWVLPMAIDRYAHVTFAARSDSTLRAHSTALGETRQVDLHALEEARGRGWFSYLAGTAWALLESGLRPSGVDLLVEGDLPLGSGLSSSAALEMATARALCVVSGASWSPREMALAGQRAENEFVGVACGVMDQLISAAASPGHALLIDCRSITWRPVRLPVEGVVVVLDTRTPRALSTSAYNERRASCDRAARAVRSLAPGVRSLRDVDGALLEAARSRMDATTYRRACHVLAEIARPAALAEALQADDLPHAGELMNDSHASLRDLYEVSSPELDRITDLARRHPRCFGARLTGAGFGGCAIALVEASGVDAFVEDVGSAYDAHAEIPCRLFAVRPVGGASIEASSSPVS